MPEVESIWARLGLKVDKKSFDKGDELINGIKGAVAGYLGLAGLGVIEGMVASTVELGGHLDDLSQKTGLSAEALQEWGYAAKLSGGDMDEFAAAATKLNRGLFEAQSTGKGPVADSMKLLGISFQSAGFKSLSLDDKMMEIADHLSGIKDPAKKTAIAMDLFGKSGANLIPVLNGGKEGIGELREEFKQFELSSEAVGVLDKLGDSVDSAKAKLLGLKNQAVAALAPVLQEMVDKLMAWVMANKALIANIITGAVEGLVAVVHGLATAVSVVVTVIEFFIEHAELAKSLLIAIGTVITGFIVVWAAAWVAAAALPLAIIAGITAVVFAVRWLIKNWDKVWDKVKTIARAIKNAIVAVGSAIKDAFTKAFEFVADLPVVKQLIWLAKKLYDLGGAVPGAVDQVKDIAAPGGVGRFFDKVKTLGSTGTLDPSQLPGGGAPSKVDPNARASIEIKGGNIDINVSGANGDPEAIGRDGSGGRMIFIDSWPYDLMVSGELKFSSNITTHPMEEGADTTDHIKNKPMEFTLECIVSDTPIGAIAQHESRRVDEISEAVFGSDQVPLPSAEAYDRLLAIHTSCRPVTIEIPVASRSPKKPNKRTFFNMGLEELSEPLGPDSDGGLIFSATFRECVLIKNQKTTVRTATPAGKRQSRKAVIGQKLYVDKRILWRMGHPPGSPLVVNYEWLIINVDQGGHPIFGDEGHNLLEKGPMVPLYTFSGKGDPKAAARLGLEPGIGLNGDQLADMFADLHRDRAFESARRHAELTSDVPGLFGDQSGTPHNVDMSRFEAPPSDAPNPKSFDNDFVLDDKKNKTGLGNTFLSAPHP